MRRFQYETCCVNLSMDDVPDLNSMIDEARDVTVKTLRRHCSDLEEWEEDMGYSVGAERGLHLKDDWAVSFHKSLFRGRPCYYIRHSAIEYIWTESA